MKSPINDCENINFFGIVGNKCVLNVAKPRRSISQSLSVRQSGILSPRLFALYVDDLSRQLIDARSGCFIEHQCINHIMYAVDSCILAPSALGLQKLLGVCYKFSQCNDIVLNSIKSVPLHSDRLNRTSETNYLGYLLNEDQSDGKDIVKQMSTLYIRSNKLLRMFSYCNINVKIELFRSYCPTVYCCSRDLNIEKHHKKLTVSFNNVHRRMLNILLRCIASTM